MLQLRFHPRLLVRTPGEPFSPFLDENLTRQYLQKDANFREALYLASPRLLATAESTALLPDKQLFPLARYILRSRYRATPFGLFSGVATAEWGSDTALRIGEKYTRHTRLDMQFLCTLARELARKPEVRQQLVYSPNTSHYFLGNDLRYVEQAGTPILSSIKNDDWIKIVLAAASQGADFKTLRLALEAQGVSSETAHFFLYELIDAQVVVSELEPSVTGTDFFTRMIAVLDRIAHPSVAILREVVKKLSHLDHNGYNDFNAYRELTELLRQVGEIPDKSRLFCTVRVNHFQDSARTLSRNYQTVLLNTLHKLAPLAAPPPASLRDFISRFYERYEEEEVPLLTALDVETGIGYPAAHDYTPLTEGIIVEEDDTGYLKWKAREKLLFRSLQQAQHENLYEIPLPSLDTSPPEMGPSLAVMFRLVGQDRVFLEHAGGSSATVLAGRFGPASPDIEEILRDIARKESKNNPDVIFAEIVHLPENRAGNILHRPAFREYEIPYLAQSSLPDENQIYLRDLYLSVRDNRVILWHKKLNKRVIPRLGSAHNFRGHGLPVYRFLGDLQTQGFPPFLDFFWGDIAREFVFLPRVVNEQVIVSPAMWQLPAPQSVSSCASSFEAWRQENKLPMAFVLAEGDNELFIDSSLPLHRKVFLDAIRGQKKVLLKEYLGDNSIPVKNTAGKAMANQFVAFLTRTDTFYRYKAEKSARIRIQRTFGPGSEWLYLKYYCGPKIADQILRQAVAPMLQEAEKKGWIDKWFFIRYQDPENHLRVRFHLADTRFLQQVLSASDRYTRNFVSDGVLWKVQTDTYRRELERYGSKAMEEVEHLFQLDSRVYIDFLLNTEGDIREEMKWLWGLRHIDRQLQAAGLSTQNKRLLVQELRDRFAAEFRMTRQLKSQIDHRYRFYRTRIENFLQTDQHAPQLPPYYRWQIQMAWDKVRAKETDGPTFDRILSGVIHMTVNRLISSDQRLHELLMYDFLHRHYTSCLALERKEVRVS